MRSPIRSKWSVGWLAVLMTLAIACGSEEDPVGDDDDDDLPPDEIPSYSVTGTVVDFATNQPVDAQATRLRPSKPRTTADHGVRGPSSRCRSRP